MAQFVAVPGDPSAYLDTGSNPAIPQYCPNGFKFDAANGWCIPADVGATAISIDSVSPGTDPKVIAGASTTGASVGEPLKNVVSLLDPYVNVGLSYRAPILASSLWRCTPLANAPNLPWASRTGLPP
jgi:hypothetical protein